MKGYFSKMKVLILSFFCIFNIHQTICVQIMKVKDTF